MEPIGFWFVSEIGPPEYKLCSSGRGDSLSVSHGTVHNEVFQIPRFGYVFAYVLPSSN